ncbi:MAG: radical SAM/SPASM domain-containing protein [Salinivirgaceae bacterium]|jgi:MoaA/NifB/PqqE/SkfB family radical SAM enzyme|nr:radical SAM/SPASM domain-containing protein [Salinivirgaceae bacterium]
MWRKVQLAITNIRFLSQKRGITILKNVFFHLWAQLSGKVYPQLPYALSLELSGVCNLKCPQCPVGLGLIKRAQPFMSKEDAYKIIDEFAPFGTVLNLYFQGESLLNPNFCAITNYAAKQKVFTILSTNAAFISKNTATNLVQSGIHRIIISVDGADQQSYEKYRSGGDLETVWRSISWLMQARKSQARLRPEIIVQTLVNKYNEHDLSVIKDKALTLGADRVVFKTMQLYSDREVWLPKTKKFQRYKRQNQAVKINRCFRAFSSMVITSDLSYVPCCFDKFANHRLNTPNQTLRQVAKTDKRRAFLSQIYKHKTGHSICENCSMGRKV